MDELAALDGIARRIDPRARLLRAWPLTGGVSAQITAFEMELPGGDRRRLVLRVYGEVDRTQNPDVAAHEYRLLQILQQAGLPAPAPVLLDTSRDIPDTPYLVIAYVEGETVSGADVADDARLRRMAAYLAGLHRIDASNTGLAFLRRAGQGVTARLNRPPQELGDGLDEARIRATLATVWPLPARNAPVLLHGDYWPGNVLWSGDRIAAVLDWEDAAVGDPLADLANARLEILWAAGVDAMQRFTRHYLSLAKVDAAHLPYWDLYAALRPIAGMAGWGLEGAVLQEMRQTHRYFTAQAFDALSAR